MAEQLEKERQEAAKIEAEKKAMAELLGLTILQYDCKMMELEGTQKDLEFRFTAEQAENLENMKQELENWKAKAAEEAKLAQENHNWEMKEIERKRQEASQNAAQLALDL